MHDLTMAHCNHLCNPFICATVIDMDYKQLEQFWIQRRQNLCQDAKTMNGPELAKKYQISTQRVYQILGDGKDRGKAKRSNQGHRRRQKQANGAGSRKAIRNRPNP